MAFPQEKQEAVQVIPVDAYAISEFCDIWDKGGPGLGYRVFSKIEVMFQNSFLKGNHDFLRSEVN